MALGKNAMARILHETARVQTFFAQALITVRRGPG
ncbi:MAG: hypothetical protein JWR37_2915 [Mycobacterium sp.]|jgi:hypothetical protein|nr:hypothetical protein [Mycobacterium sp.]